MHQRYAQKFTISFRTIIRTGLLEYEGCRFDYWAGHMFGKIPTRLLEYEGCRFAYWPGHMFAVQLVSNLAV